MKNTKVFPVVKLATLALAGVTLAGSMSFAAPPTRQTPMVVSKDKQGVVEVGPCQMPPAAGGQVCTPNARDYGYFEGTWRQWPTQQRYDQKFPQAIGSTPISPYASRPAPEPQLATAAPAPAPMPTPAAPQPGMQEGGYGLPNMQQLPPTGGNDSESSILQEIIPGMAPAAPAQTTPAIQVDPSSNIDLPTIELEGPSSPEKTSAVPGPTEQPAAATPATQPEPSTPAPAAPAAQPEKLEPLPEPSIPVTNPAAPSEEEMMPTLDSPNVKKSNAAPKVTNPMGDITPEVPEVKNLKQENESGISDLPDLDEIKDTGKNPADPFDFSSADVPNLSDLAEVDECVPSFSSDLASVESAPVEEQPVASTTPMAEFVPVDNTNMDEYPEYNAQLAVSDIVPADSVSVPAAWEANEVAVSENSIAQTNYAAPSAPFVDMNSSMPSVADSLAATAEKKVGLDGFCPVSLLNTEEWVKGKECWSVLHHGVTYYLSSPEMVQQFLSNPEKYAPVMDGNDPVARKDTRANVTGTTDFCVVYEGQLYMFSSEENMKKFFDNPAQYR